MAPFASIGNLFDNQRQMYPSRIHWKMQRCRTNPYYSKAEFMLSRIHVNCGLWNVHCSIFKVEIISLAFKGLISLRLDIKTCDQTSLKICLPLFPKMHKKRASVTCPAGRLSLVNENKFLEISPYSIWRSCCHHLIGIQCMYCR